MSAIIIKNMNKTWNMARNMNTIRKTNRNRHT